MGVRAAPIQAWGSPRSACALSTRGYTAGELGGRPAGLGTPAMLSPRGLCSQVSREGIPAKTPPPQTPPRSLCVRSAGPLPGSRGPGQALQGPLCPPGVTRRNAFGAYPVGLAAVQGPDSSPTVTTGLGAPPVQARAPRRPRSPLAPQRRKWIRRAGLRVAGQGAFSDARLLSPGGCTASSWPHGELCWDQPGARGWGQRLSLEAAVPPAKLSLPLSCPSR